MFYEARTSIYKPYGRLLYAHHAKLSLRSRKSMTLTDGRLVLGRFGGQLDILDESLAEFNLALR